MGFNSTFSGGVGPTSLPCNISNSSFCGGLNNNNGTNNYSTSLFGAGLFPLINKHSSINEVMQQCNMIGSAAVWFSIKVFILMTGLPANVSLLWLLMSSKEALSASEVLGLNLSLLDILYCLCLPVDIYTVKHYNVSKQMLSAGDSLSTLNLFGCPVLFACICVASYLAAANPGVNTRLGMGEFRAAVYALTWLLTLVAMLLGYFRGVFSMALYLALNISVQFLIMLLCLVGMLWVLGRSGPGEGIDLKRTALKNILAVLVPSVVAYTPLLVLEPFISMWHPEKQDQEGNRVQCLILQLLLAFPNFGLFIGPLFYLSRLRKLLLHGRNGDNEVLAD